jgi:murein DD-endopeptidase MepM/ murein hydrolase activator NlpD
MNGDWLHSELQRVSEGKPVSTDLYRMANRAGTTTSRYLLEQLRFYPQLDPQGEARKYLENKVRQQRQGQTVSSANWQGATRGSGLGMVPVGYNPLAPGSWLMNLLMPPAAAATMPANFPAYSGGAGAQSFSGSLAPFNGVLALLRSGEGGWDSANRGGAGDTPGGVRGLSGMTLGQWKGLQSRGYNALGAYQFIPKTLKLAASELGLSDNTVMTPEVQGRLAVQLMVGSKRPRLAAYLKGQSNDIGSALDDLALEWASVHTRGGGTAYPGVGGNAASISRSSAQQVLQQARAAYLGSGGGGATSRQAPPPPSGWRTARDVQRASEFGNREAFRRHNHEGADVSFRQSTPLAFSVGGRVLAVYRTSSTARESNGGYGNYMDVQLDSGHVVRLAHLSQIPQGFAAGSRFTPGQSIGLSGGSPGAPGSGRSSGAHLHLEEHDRPGMGNAETTRGKRNPARRGGALDYLLWRS